MYRTFTTLIYSIAMALAVMTTSTCSAQIIDFNFAGNGGSGLLPGNEVGANTATAANSTAFGDEAGAGLLFDVATNTLAFDFAFQGLDGGLNTGAASGIHLHLPGMLGDPFNQTGGIVLNLNNFDPNDVVTNTNVQIANGATAGQVTGLIDLSNSPELIDALLDEELYLNIHSNTFGGGELRGTLVTAAIPEPGSMTVVSLALAGLVARRRRTA